ncbi:MAG: hypothetical protein HYS81_01490 [Candidatus Aenigmatarchaeota archaeon]|nr:MAG: hypothetical protein HYS81_01490 [Candidatus Aenigmarchaeota archaeon]
MKNWFRIKGETLADTIENVSSLLIAVSAIFIFFGIAVGTFVPGIPVAVAITGALTAILGVGLYVLGELSRVEGSYLILSAAGGLTIFVSILQLLGVVALFPGFVREAIAIGAILLLSGAVARAAENRK